MRRALRLSRPADPIEVLEARSRARAQLVMSGDLGLHAAVDELQRYAVSAGLIDCLGQDEVQRVIASAFEPHCGDVP